MDAEYSWQKNNFFAVSKHKVLFSFGFFIYVIPKDNMPLQLIEHIWSEEV